MIWTFPEALRVGRPALLVLDIDGTVAGGGYIPPEKRTLERYSSLPVASLYLIHVLHDVLEYPNNSLHLMYLTKRLHTMHATTREWLRTHKILAPVHHVQTQADKLFVLKELLPAMYNTAPSDVAFFDDRWKELQDYYIIPSSMGTRDDYSSNFSEAVARRISELLANLPKAYVALE